MIFLESFTAMAWQSNNPWNQSRNVQSQRNNSNKLITKKRQQNWKDGNRFNSPRDGSYSFNESWQQYQNNCWQPVPQNIYPMPNRLYAGYRMSYNGPRLPQCGNSSNSDSTNQYYQSAESSFQSNIQNQYPRVLFGAPPRFNPSCPSVGMNCHQFSHMSYSYMNTSSYPTYMQPPMPMTDANAYWPTPISPPIPSDTINAIADSNSSN